MTEPIHKENYKGFTIEIYQDDDAQSPAEWGDDNLFLAANHRDFYVKPPKDSTFESVIDDYKKTHHVFSLEAYIHGGVVLALAHEGNFPDRQWDVSQLGAVFVAKSEAKTRARARKLAQGLVREWNCYLSGEIYRYFVKDQEENEMFSCGGFYADDTYLRGREAYQFCLENARDEADREYRMKKQKREARLKAQVIARTPLDRRCAPLPA